MPGYRVDRRLATAHAAALNPSGNGGPSGPLSCWFFMSVIAHAGPGVLVMGQGPSSEAKAGDGENENDQAHVLLWRVAVDRGRCGFAGHSECCGWFCVGRGCGLD